ncbi:M23 family metallopeptidase [Streptomyces sp. DSM 110735]|uniref:M23 family metallopeptidase n=1 Tax=Streptomyces sp. DSM 110735 TaxID=2775031 RepID=UPI0018F5B404|nr:M23 family metallopeptidase [Streptomyces sp. DSM 110735]MBJ7907603.1 M23 family metallopeptidase [Streptomyces sp. DSM 110735]
MASDPHTPFAPTPGENDTFGYGAPRSDGPWEEWNPTEESLPSARGGRHRVAKQRGGGLARSSTVLGVGVIAAVGAGGMASANTGKPPVSIALPDLPGVDSLLDHGSDEPAPSLSAVGSATAQSEESSDAGEALRSRIIAQAAHQQSKAESRATAAAVAAADKQTADAADKAAKEAAAQAADAKEKAEADAKKKAESDRLASLAKQYTLPTSGYTITGTFGEPGALWSSGYHTGLDFAAPTGTLIKAIHGGTVTQAGWAGAYGYRTVLTLDDGTELWFCHQSSISVKTGQKVATGEVIGRVGATGNVTGPHLHLEVHPGGQATGIDPMTWLRGKGLNP